jgi:hypothetical protein
MPAILDRPRPAMAPTRVPRSIAGPGRGRLATAWAAADAAAAEDSPEALASADGAALAELAISELAAGAADDAAEADC